MVSLGFRVYHIIWLAGWAAFRFVQEHAGWCTHWSFLIIPEVPLRRCSSEANGLGSSRAANVTEVNQTNVTEVTKVTNVMEVTEVHEHIHNEGNPYDQQLES